ncbi:MAG TPA: GntR family transcriptional regulator [Gemmatimonadaceae bacterium]|nr:GntR family transcriptional regulator [Gemmatimonadaceae bacterium]
MLILVDPNNGVPVYRQVADQIRFQIATGRAATGDEIPSTRALSLRLGINPMTVSKAYGILEEEGLVIRRPGLPLVVAPKQTSHDTTNLEQLAAVLQPAALATVQLGVPADKAVAQFRKLMEHNKSNGEKSE